jgi:DNA invertase Pin-like site-specific DNA recombinase
VGGYVRVSFAEFERAPIVERQREGIVAAKQRGAYAGRKPALTAEFGISRETVYSYLRPATTAAGGRHR